LHYNGNGTVTGPTIAGCKHLLRPNECLSQIALFAPGSLVLGPLQIRMDPESNGDTANDDNNDNDNNNNNNDNDN
jgi:hypothetical protein